MARRSFQRKPSQREQRKRFLIVVEGAVTECSYFNAIRTSRKISTANIQVVPPGPTSPIEIVNRAVRLRDEQRRSDSYDEVWCVFDVEAKVTQPAREGLAEALRNADEKKIKVALSNPCFELWLLLHHEDCTAWIASDAVQRRCSELNIVTDKKIQDATGILSRHDEAKPRAENQSQSHNRNGTTNPAQRNPETTVHRLVDALFDAFPQEEISSPRHPFSAARTASAWPSGATLGKIWMRV